MGPKKVNLIAPMLTRILHLPLRLNFHEYIPLQRYLFHRRRISYGHVGLKELSVSKLKRISKYDIKIVIIEMRRRSPGLDRVGGSLVVLPS